MFAQVLTAFGATSHFKAEQIAEPTLLPHQVLIRQQATSVNPVDTKIRALGLGIAPALPAVLGSDVAGTVVAVGAAVDSFAIGDEVYACSGGMLHHAGSYAELVTVDARLLAHKPQTLTLRETAALPLVSITAWEALVEKTRVKPGDHVLIYGATGGVGHIAVQLAKAFGATVTAVVSSAHKAQIARELGADHIVNYREETVQDYVQRLTNGAGFDVVFDTVGGDNLNAALQAAKVRGQVVSIVVHQHYDLTPAHMKSLSVHAVMMLVPLLHNVELERHAAILREIAALVDAGKLKPLLDTQVFHLRDIAAAHDRLESGKAIGKIVVEIAST